MAVAVAGSAKIQSGVDTGAPSTSDATYTAESGSNRLLVIIIQGEDLVEQGFDAEFGGVAFVDATTDTVDGASGINGYIGYILEANIPTGAKSITVADGNGLSWSNNSWAGAIYTLTGVDQTTPQPQSAVEAFQDNAKTWTTGSITSDTDGILMFGCAVRSPHSSASSISGYTELFDIDEGGGSYRVAFKLITTGSSETATADWDNVNEAGAHYIVGFQPSSGADVLTSDPGALVFTGAAAALVVGLLSVAGSLAFTGGEATLTQSDNQILTADPGALLLTGGEATLAQSDNQILTADPGALLFTGADAALANALLSDPGALLLTGSEATLTATDNQTLTSDPGALLFTGADADLVAQQDFTLTADPGSLLFTGGEATLTATDNQTLTSDPGSLLFTGSEATLTATDNQTLTSDPGALLFTGSEATLTASGSEELTSDPGALLFTGADADLVDSTPALIFRRGGVRFLREPDPDIREEKVKQLTALIKPAIKPAIKPKQPGRPSQERQGSLMQAIASATDRMTPAQQARTDKLLQQTGISIEELLILLE